MKYTHYLILLFLFIGNITMVDAQTKKASSSKEKPLWQQQVNTMKEKGGKDAPQLLGYKYQGVIETLEDLSTVKARLMSEENYFPTCDGNAGMKLCKVKELKASGSKKDIEAFSTSLAKCVDQLVQVGCGTVELKWKYGPNVFKTICIVSDKGIVYDNIITNLFSESKVVEGSGAI